MIDEPLNSDDLGDAEQRDTCPICHGAGYVRLDVPVGHPQFGKAVPCRCKRVEIRDMRLARLRRAGNLEQLQRMTFDAFETQGLESTEASMHLQYLLGICREYAQRPSGWMLMRGTHGCGKTHLAAAIANHRVEQGLPVLFEVVPDLVGPATRLLRAKQPRLVRRAL